jgi:bacterioferritin-associated ferredoxin
MIACICAGKSESEIKEFFRGGNTIEDIQVQLNVCMGCMLCEPYIQKYFDEVQLELNA